MRRVTKENLTVQINRLYKIKEEQGQLSMNGEYTLQAYEMLLATMDSEPVALHMGEAINVFNALKVEQLSKRVNNAGLGPMGASEVQVWTSKAGGRLEFISANGGCTLNIFPQPAQPVADREPVENHIGSKNALDAIVSFIKSKSNPTVKCYEGVSEQLFKDNCHGIHSHVIEYILKLGEQLEDLRAEQAEMQPAPVADSEPVATVSWVPVSERLPEKGVDLLVKIKPMTPGLYDHDVAQLSASDEFIRSACGYCSTDDITDDVTHWSYIGTGKTQP